MSEWIEELAAQIESPAGFVEVVWIVEHGNNSLEAHLIDVRRDGGVIRCTLETGREANA